MKAVYVFAAFIFAVVLCSCSNFSSQNTIQESKNSATEVSLSDELQELSPHVNSNDESIFLQFAKGPSVILSPVVIEYNNPASATMGYIGDEGDLVFPSTFFQAKCFSEGFAAVSDEYGEWYYINTNGERQGTQKYVYAGDFSDGRAVVVTQNNITKVIDSTGREVFIPQDQFAPEAQYYENVLVGYKVCYDLYGKVLFQTDSMYRLLGRSQAGLIAAVRKSDQRIVYFDQSGALTLEISRAYNSDAITPYDFCNERACVQNKNGKWGFVDTNGNLVIPYIYDNPSRFSEGLAHVTQSENQMFIDTDGNVVFTLDFDFPYMVGDFSEEIAPLYQFASNNPDEYLAGFINRSGDLIVECQFSYFYSTITEYIPYYELAAKGGAMIKNGRINVFYRDENETWFGCVDSAGTVIYRN